MSVHVLFIKNGLADRMNSKFFTPRLLYSMEDFSFAAHSARACICKQDTHNSLKAVNSIYTQNQTTLSLA